MSLISGRSRSLYFFQLNGPMHSTRRVSWASVLTTEVGCEISSCAAAMCILLLRHRSPQRFGMGPNQSLPPRHRHRPIRRRSRRAPKSPSPTPEPASPRTTTTGSDGSYLFDLVQVGTYKLTVDKPGFSTFLQDGIVLELNQNGRLDVALKIGSGKSDRGGYLKRRPGGHHRRRPRKSRKSAHDQRSSAWRIATLCSSACSKLAFLRPDPDDGSGNPFLRQRPALRVPDLSARRRQQHRFSRQQHCRQSESRRRRRIQDSHQQLRRRSTAALPVESSIRLRNREPTLSTETGSNFCATPT